MTGKGESAYDVIIVGAGIAGLTSALYASRQRMKTLVISKDLGGQLLLTPEIQNYPGFSSISGYDLISRVKEQAELYGTEIIFDEVIEIRDEVGFFEVKTAYGQSFKAYALILAIGKIPKELNIPGENRFKGRGVSYCVICDAPLFKGKKTALIGWGRHALNSILLLKKYSAKVYWIFQGDSPVKNQESLLEAIGENVELIPNSTPIEVLGEEKVSALVVEDGKTGEVRKINVDGVFIELGYVAKTDVAKELVKLNERGEIVVNEKCETSRPGIFAAGDVTNQPFKQAVISAAQGAIAALSAYNYVMNLKGRKTYIKGDWKHIPTKRG